MEHKQVRRQSVSVVPVRAIGVSLPPWVHGARGFASAPSQEAVSGDKAVSSNVGAEAATDVSFSLPKARDLLPEEVVEADDDAMEPEHSPYVRVLAVMLHRVEQANLLFEEELKTARENGASAATLKASREEAQETLQAFHHKHASQTHDVMEKMLQDGDWDSHAVVLALRLYALSRQYTYGLRLTDHMQKRTQSQLQHLLQLLGQRRENSQQQPVLDVDDIQAALEASAMDPALTNALLAFYGQCSRLTARDMRRISNRVDRKYTAKHIGVRALKSQKGLLRMCHRLASLQADLRNLLKQALGKVPPMPAPPPPVDLMCLATRLESQLVHGDWKEIDDTFEQFETLYNEVEQRDPVPVEVAWRVRFTQLAMLHKWDQLVDSFKQFCENVMLPSTDTYNALLHAVTGQMDPLNFAQAAKDVTAVELANLNISEVVDTVQALHLIADDKGVQVNRLTYFIIINALGPRREVCSFEVLAGFYADMLRRGLFVSRPLLVVMLRAAAIRKEMPAVRVFWERALKDESLVLSGDLCAVVLRAAADVGHADEMATLLLQMRERGAKLDTSCYNALLLGFGKEGDSHMLTVVLRELDEAEDVFPNLDTYITMCRCFEWLRWPEHIASLLNRLHQSESPMLTEMALYEAALESLFECHKAAQKLPHADPRVKVALTAIMDVFNLLDELELTPSYRVYHIVLKNIAYFQSDLSAFRGMALRIDGMMQQLRGYRQITSSVNTRCRPVLLASSSGAPGTAPRALSGSGGGFAATVDPALAALPATYLPAGKAADAGNVLSKANSQKAMAQVRGQPAPEPSYAELAPYLQVVPNPSRRSAFSTTLTTHSNPEPIPHEVNALFTHMLQHIHDLLEMKIDISPGYVPPVTSGKDRPLPVMASKDSPVQAQAESSVRHTRVQAAWQDTDADDDIEDIDVVIPRDKGAEREVFDHMNPKVGTEDEYAGWREHQVDVTWYQGLADSFQEYEKDEHLVKESMHFGHLATDDDT